jgi:hypothetical protein
VNCEGLLDSSPSKEVKNQSSGIKVRVLCDQASLDIKPSIGGGHLVGLSLDREVMILGLTSMWM